MNRDDIIYVALLVLAYPLSVVFRAATRTASPSVRHVAGGGLGALLALVTCGVDCTHAVVSSSLCYLLLRVAPRRAVAPLTFAAAFGYLAVMRLAPHLVLPGAVGVSGPANALQLILTLKLTSVAFDVVGTKTHRTPTRTAHDRAHANSARWVPAARRHSGVDVLPTPLEYAGYLFFFPGLLTGPFCSIREYLAWADGSLFSALELTDGQEDKLARPPRSGEPSATRAAMHTAALAVLPAAAHLLGAAYFPMSPVYTPEFQTAPSLLYRLVYAWFAVRCFAYRFEFAWLLSEAACIASGLGFSGYVRHGDGTVEPEWEGTRNVHLVDMELGTNLPTVLRHWNVSVHHWVKDYVYNRAAAMGHLPRFVPQMAAFGTLAYWHGFHPGYFVMFLSTPLMTHATYSVKTAVRGIEARMPALYSIIRPLVAPLGWFLTWGIINYLGIAFITLDWARSVQVMGSLYYVGHVAAVVVILVCIPMPKAPRAARPAAARGPVTRSRTKAE